MVLAAYGSPQRRGVSSVACALGRGGLAEGAPMFIDPEMLSRLRRRMMSVPYRVVGSAADAEDAVQDAFMRLQEAGGVCSPEGFPVRTPGVVFTSGGAAIQVVALCIAGAVRAVYMTNNPDR